MNSGKKTNDVTVALTGVQGEVKVGRLAAKGISRTGARKGNKKFEREALIGNEFSSVGHMMRKERIIDRKNDRYTETVINEDTGEVVRQIDEPLSQHKGRGSAKSGMWIAVATILILGLAGCAAELSSKPSRSASEAAPYVGVFTGEFVDGKPLYRFPAILVVGSRSSVGPDI
jgi:hypothetical protein